MTKILKHNHKDEIELILHQAIAESEDRSEIITPYDVQVLESVAKIALQLANKDNYVYFENYEVEWFTQAVKNMIQMSMDLSSDLLTLDNDFDGVEVESYKITQLCKLIKAIEE